MEIFFPCVSERLTNPKARTNPWCLFASSSQDLELKTIKFGKVGEKLVALWVGRVCLLFFRNKKSKNRRRFRSLLFQKLNNT